jgi:hypothetical protein
MLHKETITFKWDSLEFEFKEKTKKWYWISAIVIIIFIIGAILLKNYLFAFLILFGGFLMFVMSTKQPIVLPVEVSEHGVKIHDEMFPYTIIENFWIGENKNNNAVLIIKTNKKITPVISINIDPQINIIQLREYLMEFVEEKEMKEPFTDRLIEKIGF